MFLLVFLMLFLLLSQLFFPRVVALALEEAVRYNFPHAADVQVEVEAVPATKILLGKFDVINLYITEGSVGGLPVSRFQSRLKEVQIDWGELLQEKKLVLRYQQPSFTEIVLLASDVSRYLEQQLRGRFLKPEVRLGDDQVTLLGSVSIFSMPVELEIDGTLEISGAREIAFKPRNLRINRVELGNPFRENILAQTRFLISLEQIPFVSELEKIEVGQGKLIIKARS
ncbi:hypothetical protein ACD_39C01086G0002 [Calderihabitans maritimus]|uniref:DUF2993 domain-containing protein n=1 Tax=Calderihabitans maritimus TaxID=1246530 RepID=A0A1Z5HUG8_9FIRM|nr:hypothetical protein ACD_39C01086G0002 [Calderihabitans maritimus]